MIRVLRRRVLARAAAMAISAVALACIGANSAASQEIKLKGVYAWSPPFFASLPLIWFKEALEKELAGKVSLNILGAAEVAPPFEQFEGLRNGTFDVLLTSASYYTGQLPVAQAGLFVSEPVETRRANGYYALVRKLHLEKTNTIYLSQVGGPVGGFRFYTKKKIERIDDLKNLKLRGSPAYKSMTIALGAVPLIIAPGETYAALERGVADGLGWGVSGLTQFGFQEVTKFVLDHPFQTVDTGILMNAATYNKLPADVKAAIERIAEQLEGESTRRIQKIYDDEDKVLRGHGLTFTKLPKAEEIGFYRRVYDTGWSDILKVDAENGAKLKQLGFKPTS